MILLVNRKCGQKFPGLGLHFKNGQYLKVSLPSFSFPEVNTMCNCMQGETLTLSNSNTLLFFGFYKPCPSLHTYEDFSLNYDISLLFLCNAVVHHDIIVRFCDH